MQDYLTKVYIVPISLTTLLTEIIQFVIGKIQTKYLTLKPHQVLLEWCLEIHQTRWNKKHGCDMQWIVKAIAVSDCNL